MQDAAAAPIVVFVVEDQDLLREIVIPSLEEAGYTVLEASSGDSAMRAIKEKGDTIRALVTDVDLGGKVTGWDIAHHARGMNPSLPVVYMTGASGDEWAANGVPNSILLTKPFAPAQLVTAVSQLLNTAPPSPA
jgi:DNA-binding NtrC family response regulator